MEVLVDGSRTNPDLWLESQTMPSAAVPSVSPEEHRVAQALSLTDEEYARSKYAIEKTRLQLQSRAERLGKIVNLLLSSNQSSGEVRKVWFNTFRGVYRIDLDENSSEFQIAIPEDVVDAVLDGGSAHGKAQIEALLAGHLAAAPAARAS
jgi:hypothetical protein